MSKLVEGSWKYFRGSKKEHYSAKKGSLCGKFSELCPSRAGTGENKCKACEKALDKIFWENYAKEQMKDIFLNENNA